YARFERHYVLIAHPVAEEMQAEAGIAQERQMSARIRQGDDAVRIAQHRADRLLVRVQQRSGKERVEVLRKAQIEQEVDRMLAFPRREHIDRAAFELRVLGPGGLRDEHLLPLAIEHAA